MTIAQLAELVIELTNSPSEIVQLPEKRDSSDPDRRQPDISRAKEVLKWEPTVPLREGLLKTIENFEARL